MTVANLSGSAEPTGLPEDGFSRALCASLAEWRYEDLPAEVVGTLKRLLLDTLGVIGGAARAPGIPELNRRLAGWEPAGAATGLIGRRPFSPPSAALANGAAAHALDFDDQNDPARVHAHCVVLPAVLATAEATGGVSGRDFLLAMATGVEFHARLGLACYNALGLGWHPTATLGAMAAAVAAARVLRLDAGQTLHALGIAFHQAGGTAQCMADGALAKRLGAGFAARAGLTAAFLAADGLTGPTRPLEGEAGLFRLHAAGEVAPERLTEGLGREWEILKFSIKPYPCCRCNHTAIGLGLQFRKAGIRPADVQRAEILLPRVNWKTVGQPYDPAQDSVVHAQFNVVYALARALADGEVNLNSYCRPNITDPGIVAFTNRIQAVEDPRADPTAIEPARVKLWLTDGRTLEAESDTVKGSPADPLSQAEVLEKFRGCMAFGLGAAGAAVERLAETALNLEREPDAVVLAERFPGAETV